jgi:glutamate dehydrogenase/leucine dehydrogenase
MQLSQLEGTSKNGSRFWSIIIWWSRIVFCNDKDTGLKAIIGIHNSVMGPALGGTRMFNYNEWEALNDVLRLSGYDL